MSWSAPSSSGSAPISHYRIRYFRPSLNNHPVHGTRGAVDWTGTVTGTSHTSGNLLAGISYTITITAVNRDNQASNPVSVTATVGQQAAGPPSAPRNVRAEAHESTKIKVSWSAPSSSGSAPISHYLVRYKNSSPNTGLFTSIDLSDLFPYRVTGTSHTSHDLRYGATYTVTVVAVNRNDRTSEPATATATTRRQPKPHGGKPKILGFDWLKGSWWFTNDEDDVIVFWDSSRVSNASGYYVERRYVSYPDATVTVNNRRLTIPDLGATPIVRVDPIERRVRGSGTRQYQFPDGYEEKYNDNNWILQFRVTPYNSGGRGEPSDWVSLGVDELIEAMQSVTSCNALNKAVETYSLASNIWSAVVIASMVVAGGGPIPVALYLAGQVVSGVQQSVIVGSVKSIAGCFASENIVDGLRKSIPPLGWFLDIVGATEFLKSFACVYGNLDDITTEAILSQERLLEQCRS